MFKLSKRPHVISISGGLGSQILGYSKYLYLKNELEIQNMEFDVKYFTSPEIGKNHPGLEFWPWGLDWYGYELPAQGRASYKRYVKYPHRKHEEISDLEIWLWLRKSNGYFPTDPLRLASKIEELRLTSNFNLIHVRRGDYEKIAALTTSHQKYFKLLTSIQKSLFSKSLVVSDDPIEEEQKNRYLEILGEDISFLSKFDLSDKLTHDLMRNASVLVTANSTFSLSAALLNRQAELIFSPIRYAHGKELNNDFLGLGDWYMHQ